MIRRCEACPALLRENYGATQSEPCMRCALSPKFWRNARLDELDAIAREAGRAGQ